MDPARLGSGTFRRLRPAAPLKLDEVGRAVDEHRALPQATACGPIEARSTPRRRGGCSGLPQATACGPIEAQRTLERTESAPGLPQATACGPIEASS